MTTTNVTTLNSENVNLEELREINLSDEEWDEQPIAQMVLPNFKVPPLVDKHRKLRQQLERMLQESSFAVLLDELRKFADARSEWAQQNGYPSQDDSWRDSEFYDLLSMSIGRCEERARRWRL